MALGKKHDQFNIFIGSVFLVLLALVGVSVYSTVGFFFGWMFSTFIFSPDTDLGPKKRVGILGILLRPYSWIFKHRGLSHSYFLGTLSRVGYGLLIVGLMIFSLKRSGQIDLDVEGYFNFLREFFLQYDYSQKEYQFLSWFFVAYVFADACHILLDHISSLVRKII